MQQIADTLTATGALVAGIQTPHFLKQLNEEHKAKLNADFHFLLP